MGTTSSAVAETPRLTKYITTVYIHGDVDAIAISQRPLVIPSLDMTFVFSDLADAQVVIYVPFRDTDTLTLAEWAELVDTASRKLRVDMIYAPQELSEPMQGLCRMYSIIKSNDIWRDAVTLLQKAWLLETQNQRNSASSEADITC